MKKFAIIEQIRNGDSFEEIFDTKTEALKQADLKWNHLSDYDKKRLESFYVAEVDIDDDGCIDYTVGMNVVKSYK